jgi:hypothetical protein
MVICPIAIVAGCEKCPVVKVCPAKGLIGNHKKAASPTETKKSTPAKGKKN